MNVRLMHPDRDFDPKQELPRHERDLTQDLGLATLLDAMSGGDGFLRNVARVTLLSCVRNDAGTILYRQEILRDSLVNPAVLRQIYGLAEQAVEAKKKHYLGIFGRYPAGILYGSIDLLEMLMGVLVKLKDAADLNSTRFQSRGFAVLFAMVQNEFDDEYFARVHAHLAELRFKTGALVSARLGQGNEGTHYMLRKPNDKDAGWLQRIFGNRSNSFTFHIHERDEAGARALSEIRDRGINLVANAVAQSSEHVLSFFEMLKTELAFYLGCMNLQHKLTAIGARICFPRPEAVGSRRLSFAGLYDVSLSLSMERSLVANTVNADGKSLLIITGANQGGKSSFMRGVGLAQLMMQSGMFVGAETFAAALSTGLFTHYKREEDAGMKKGKLEEELGRMSDITDVIVPNAMVFFNESFSATNEREGSEIARQVVRALVEKNVKVLFVTHLYEFAHGLFSMGTNQVLFLRAERLADGTRTFKLEKGEPLYTSYAKDLYRKLFSGDDIGHAAHDADKR